MNISLRRASVLQFAVNITKTAIGALVTLYFVNALGAATFGKYALALAVTNWLLVLTNGPKTATEKRISEGESADSYYTLGVGVTLLFVALAGILVLVFSDAVERYVGFQGATAVAGLAVSLGVFRTYLGVVRNEGKVEQASLLDGTRHILRSLAQLLLVVVGYEVTALIAGEILASVFAAGVALWLTTLRLDRPSRDHVRSFYDYAKFSWLGGVKGVSYGWVDTIVLGFLVTKQIVGVYEIAWQVSAVFMILASAIGNVTFPQISSLSESDDGEEIERITRQATSVATLIVIPGAVGSFVLGPQILEFYGPTVSDVSVGAVVLTILVVARIAESYEFILLRTLAALDYPDRVFRVDVLFLVSNLSLNVVLGWLFRAPGVAFATAISMSLSVFLCWRYLPDSLSVMPSLRVVGGQVAASLIMGAVLIGLTRLYPATTTVRTLLYVGLGGAVYGVCVVVFLPIVRDTLLDWVDHSSRMLGR